MALRMIHWYASLKTNDLRLARVVLSSFDRNAAHTTRGDTMTLPEMHKRVIYSKITTPDIDAYRDHRDECRTCNGKELCIIGESLLRTADITLEAMES